VRRLAGKVIVGDDAEAGGLAILGAEPVAGPGSGERALIGAGPYLDDLAGGILIGGGLGSGIDLLDRDFERPKSSVASNWMTGMAPGPRRPWPCGEIMRMTGGRSGASWTCMEAGDALPVIRIAGDEERAFLRDGHRAGIGFAPSEELSMMAGAPAMAPTLRARGGWR